MLTNRVDVCDGNQDASALPQDQIDQMMMCFVAGMGAAQPIEIQQVSAQGMVHALAFASQNFLDDHAATRDQIMSCICNATQFPDIKACS